MVEPSERLRLMDSRARKFIEASISLVVSSHTFGIVIVIASAIAEVIVLFEFHEAGPFPILASIVIGTALTTGSLVHSGFRIRDLGLEFSEDLVVLRGQEAYWGPRGKRTIDDISEDLYDRT